MNKLFKSIGLVLVFAMCAPVLRAANHVSQPFLNGLGYLVVSNNITVTTVGSLSSNLWYVSSAGTNVQSFKTNAAGVVIPGALRAVNGWADANGNVMTNANVSVTMNDTNYVAADGQTPLPAGSRPVVIVTPDASSTNALTITLERSTDGVRYGTTAHDNFVFLVNANATTVSTYTTNLSGTFMTGAKKIRIKSIVPSNSSQSPGVIVNSINLSGYQP